MLCSLHCEKIVIIQFPLKLLEGLLYICVVDKTPGQHRWKFTKSVCVCMWLFFIFYFFSVFKNRDEYGPKSISMLTKKLRSSNKVDKSVTKTFKF